MRGWNMTQSETYDSSHADCRFVQRTTDARVHPQEVTRAHANEALGHGWPLRLITHIHRNET
jgi:hypothetical protein